MLIVRTEVWTVPSGKIAKAVVRDKYGRFVGATNQTTPVNLTHREQLVGK